MRWQPFSLACSTRARRIEVKPGGNHVASSMCVWMATSARTAPREEPRVTEAKDRCETPQGNSIGVKR
jgi:hypothetical protein